MRRRRLLTGVALALGMAGCESAETTTSTANRTTLSPRSPTRTATTAPTPTETPTDTLTDTLTETDTPTETEMETDTPTETATETASPGERKAARRIRKARADLGIAYEGYLDAAGSAASLLDVSATATAFEYPPVTNPADEARGHLDAAAKTATAAQSATIADLREVADFLATGARIQTNLGTAFEAATTAKMWWYDEKYSFLTNQLERLKSQRDEADDQFSTLRDATDAGAMAAFDLIEESTYEDKTDQFETELATLSGLPDLFDLAVTALETFAKAVGAWDTEQWSRAQVLFGNTVADFEDLMAEFDAIERADSFAPMLDEMAGVATVLRDASELARQGAKAEAEEGNSELRKEKKAAADARLRDSTIATDGIDSVERFLEAV